MVRLGFLQKRSCWIGAMPIKQHDIENQLCIDVYSAYNQDHSPLILTAVLLTAALDGCAAGGS